MINSIPLNCEHFQYHLIFYRELLGTTPQIHPDDEKEMNLWRNALRNGGFEKLPQEVRDFHDYTNSLRNIQKQG